MWSDRRGPPFLFTVFEESKQDLHSVLYDLVLDCWLHVLLIKDCIHPREAFLSEILINLMFPVLVNLSLA